MRNTRQGRDSTKKCARARANVDKANANRTESPPFIDTKQQDVYTCVFDMQNEMQAEIYEKIKDRMYTDQTGKFPVRSSGGHQYIMVLINMDSS